MVSIYEIDENTAFFECSLLCFDGPEEAWLDLVSDNRSGNYEGEAYDFIFGPVANDDVYRTFTLYTAGVLTKEQTLEQLKIKKLYNQLVLTTEKALSYLRFENYSVDEMAASRELGVFFAGAGGHQTMAFQPAYLIQYV